LIIIKSEKEIGQQREACRIVAEVLERIKETVKPGVTTKDLNDLAEKIAKKRRAIPAFKGVKARGPYQAFPAAVCSSVNNEVIHGIPSNRELIEGDIVGVDFGVLYNGFYGDAAITVPVGNISEAAKKLVNVTKESLDEAIKQALDGNRLSDISHAVQSYVEERGFSVVRDFVGHGIGRSLHEEPQIPNYGSKGRGVKLKAGMVLAIEPMINEGNYDVDVLDDGWTAVTMDGKLSAHFEHCVAITKNGPLVLTKV
jgi:methionyl aminopeptidase